MEKKRLGEIQFDFIYTLIITNTANILTPVNLFNANINADRTNFGNPANISVVCLESTYTELLAESQTNPFETMGMTIQNSGVYPEQLSELIQIMKEDAGGVRCSGVLHPQNYFNVDQKQRFVREIFPYNIKITGKSGLLFNMVAKVPNLQANALQLMIFVKKRVNLTNKLWNQPAVIEIPEMLVTTQSEYVLK